METRLTLSAGLTPLASAPAGGIVPRPEGNTGTGFFVSGSKVYDANGYEFRLRGFNHTTRSGDTTKNFDAIGEFDKTGANAIRTTFGTFGAGTTPTQRKSIVESYLAEGLVPIVEDHSATSGTVASQLQAITDRWLQSGNVQWLKQYERNVILNIANEWGPDSTVWRDAYISSIARLRSAGINAMIMVDAAGAGQDMHALNAWARDIEDADPQHNVLFSIHMYDFWRTDGQSGVGTNSPWPGAPYDIATQLSNFKASGLPIVVGEYSMTGGTDVPYITHRAMEIYDSLGIGYLAWSWNQNGSAVHDMLSQTAGWQYDTDADLSPLGQLVVNDPLLGTKSGAIPATSLRPAAIRGSVSDATDTPLAGVTVYIDDNANDQPDAGERQTTTDAGGAFALTNLPQGLHRLRTVIASAVTPKLAVALPAGDDVNVHLNATTDAPPATASLSGIAWNDDDGDGYRDPAEAALANRTIYLETNNDGQAAADEPTTSTDDAGTFAFSGLAPGTYAARILLAGGDVATTLPLPLALAAGDVVVNVSVGLAHPPAVGRIAGTLFDDVNQNGIRDTGESAQPLKDVYLDLNNNGQSDSGEPVTLTAADGTYLFTRLQPGDYTVRKSNAGWTITTPVSPVTVTAFQTVVAPPIGASEALGSVGGIVFNDMNGNGTMDTGDTPAGGLTVFIDSDSDGKLTGGERTTTSAADGLFTFGGLRSSTLSYRAVPPAGQSLTSGGVTYSLPSGGSYTGIRLGVGVFPNSPPPPTTASISGVYFEDANQNRRLDVTENRVAGAVVYLDANNNGIYDSGEPTRTTAIDGTYTFDSLAAGLYRPRSVAPNGTALTTPQIDVYLSTAQAFTIGRFGTTPSDTPPTTTQTLQAETAQFIGDTKVQTSWAGYDGDGYADFGGNGTGVQWTFTHTSAGNATVVFRYANGSGVNRPLTIYLNNVAVGTVAFPATSNWSSWQTTTPLTLSLAAGVNTLKALAGSAGGPNVDFVAITDAALPPPPPPDNTASLTGLAFDDNNGNGTNDTGDAPAANATIFLDLDGDNALDANETKTTTDSSGTFSFTGLSSGTYHVRRVTDITHTLSTPSIDVTLTNGQAKGGLSIGMKAVVVITTQTLQAEAGQVSGGTITSTTWTGYTGMGYADYGNSGSAVQWTFNHTSAGSVDVVFRYANGSTTNRPLTIYVNNVAVGTVNCPGTGGWSAWKSTTPLTVTVAAGNNTLKAVAGAAGGANVDAVTLTDTGAPPPPDNSASLTGTAFDDANGNGVNDTGDTLASGATVFLDLDGDNTLDSNETRTTTDANGNFSFTGLSSGTYHVRRVFDATHVLSTAPIDLTLTNGQTASGLSIGSKTVTAPPPGTATLGGLVYNDNNSNGKYDTGDGVAKGITVFLDVNGNNTVDSGETTTVSGTDGRYSFTSLPAGTYHVRRVFPAGLTYSTPLIDITVKSGDSQTKLSIGAKKV